MWIVKGAAAQRNALYYPQAEWVYRIPQLVDGLQKLGYRKTAKFFTPREVALIIDYLGEP